MFQGQDIYENWLHVYWMNLKVRWVHAWAHGVGDEGKMEVEIDVACY